MPQAPPAAPGVGVGVTAPTSRREPDEVASSSTRSSSSTNTGLAAAPHNDALPALAANKRRNDGKGPAAKYAMYDHQATNNSSSTPQPDGSKSGAAIHSDNLTAAPAAPAAPAAAAGRPRVFYCGHCSRALQNFLRLRVSFRKGKPSFEWNYRCNDGCDKNRTLNATAKQVMFNLVRKFQGPAVLADLKSNMLATMRAAAEAEGVEGAVKSEEYE